MMENKKIAACIGTAVAGAIIFGWTWSTFRLGNEIKWVRQNKPFVCSQLRQNASRLWLIQKEVNTNAYKNGTTAINQAFLGTLLNTMAVERQTVNDTQLKYGCDISNYNSHAD